MKFFYNLERKFKRYAIPNLMYYIILMYGVGLLMEMFAPGFYWRVFIAGRAGDSARSDLENRDIYDLPAGRRYLWKPDFHVFILYGRKYAGTCMGGIPV